VTTYPAARSAVRSSSRGQLLSVPSRAARLGVFKVLNVPNYSKCSVLLGVRKILEVLWW